MCVSEEEREDLVVNALSLVVLHTYKHTHTDWSVRFWTVGSEGDEW